MAKKQSRLLIFLAAIICLSLITALPLVADPSNFKGKFKGKPWKQYYYLTKDTFQPTEALTACEAGYHMASIWEIWDFSNLTYNTELGLTQDDSGTGPPSGLESGVGSPPIPGWVRSGFLDDDNSSCSTWTSNSFGDNAVVASPSILHLLAGAHPWDVQLLSCDESAYVWCMSD